MALFGPSKKEKELQAEVERLKQMLSPEQSNIELLKMEIKQLETNKHFYPISKKGIKNFLA